jgi:hypothetical protein
MALFELPMVAPAQRHSPTSIAAAEAMAPVLVKRQQEVLDLLRRLGPSSDNEIIAAWVAAGGNCNTPRPRRLELLRMGLVKSAGFTRHGSEVWVANSEVPQ